jgi:hypothetical protein
MAGNLKVVDPLNILREFAVKKKKDLIVLEDGYISFGDIRFPAKTLTRFHDSKGKPQTLDTLWFCLAQESKPFSGSPFLSFSITSVQTFLRVLQAMWSVPIHPPSPS